MNEPLGPDLNGLDILLTTEAAQEADRRTIEDFGIDGFTLMECAARGVVRTLEESLEESLGELGDASVVVLAGPGNNGGDGFAVARMLHDAGAFVVVLFVDVGEHATADNARNRELLEQIEDQPGSQLELRGITATNVASELARTLALGPFDLCIDALLGIGCRKPLREPVRSLAAWSSEIEHVVAIDIPTGVDSDTGRVHGDLAVSAHQTITMIGAKLGLVLGEGAEVCGDVVRVDIGVPRHILQETASLPGIALSASDDWVAARLPRFPEGAHKFRVGQAAIVAGSDAYTGAAVLASESAAAVGAGYVLCMTTERAAAALAARSPSIATRVRAKEALDTAALDRARALLVGPGLGDDVAVVRAALRHALQRGDLPLVLDADGLNAVASNASLLRELTEQRLVDIVWTPHAGEFRRLVAASGGDVAALEDALPTALVAQWAAHWNVTLVLKGSPTMVATPAGTTFIELHAGPSLATAGTGDVLAGAIAGLLAQGAPPLDAAVAALRITAASAAAFCKERSAHAMSAHDVVMHMPRTIAERFESA